MACMGCLYLPAGVKRKGFSEMKHNKLLFAGIFSTVLTALLVFSLSGCEEPEPDSGLTKVIISTDMNGSTHMSNITISNDDTMVLYVIREYTSKVHYVTKGYTLISDSTRSAAPQSTYKWYKNNDLIAGEEKGFLSIQGPDSYRDDFITAANSDKIKVAVTDSGKTVEAITTITVQ